MAARLSTRTSRPHGRGAAPCRQFLGGGDELAGEPLAARRADDGEGIEAGNSGIAAEQHQGIAGDRAVRRDGDEEAGGRRPQVPGERALRQPVAGKGFVLDRRQAGQVGRNLGESRSGRSDRRRSSDILNPRTDRASEIVSSRSGLVESSVTGHSISSSIGRDILDGLRRQVGPGCARRRSSVASPRRSRRSARPAPALARPAGRRSMRSPSSV